MKLKKKHCERSLTANSLFNYDFYDFSYIKILVFYYTKNVPTEKKFNKLRFIMLFGEFCNITIFCELETFQVFFLKGIFKCIMYLSINKSIVSTSTVLYLKNTY